MNFQKSQKNLKKGVDREGSMWYYSKAVENGREKEETREGRIKKARKFSRKAKIRVDKSEKMC